MQQTVRLLDSLGERYGEEHIYYNLRTAADAIRLLCINRPGFQKELLESYKNGVYYRVIQSGEDMAAKEMFLPLGKNDLYIVPVIGGSNEKFMKIGIGVALIAVAIVTAPATGGFLGIKGAATFAGAAAVSTTAGALGTSMLLTGVADLISPQLDPFAGGRLSGSGETSRGVGPQNVTRAMNGSQSYAYTGGGQNSVGIGATVPVAFGKVLVGSHLLSIQADVTDESSALRESITAPGVQTVTVNGQKLEDKFEVAGGIRSRIWQHDQLDKSGVSSNADGTKVKQLKLIELRDSNGNKQLNSITLTDTDYLRKSDKRRNFMIFFETVNGLYDRVGDTDGSTKVPGFITYKVVLNAEDYKDEPIIAQFQGTIQGILNKGTKYRWCHAVSMPRIPKDDAEGTDVRVKVMIVDHDTHKRPGTQSDQMKMFVRFTGYDWFNYKDENSTESLIES